ncbi:G-alpha-domain-containing protein [Exidia glandulosa HHB12029]|uniref:G-alpha-domain-containing protein n=1 Tax=Exidia glandulosa HHB12029 TaxID=1314781 RepID=A0A165I7B2_EXIGL|nr:G-alpha-domain-containing protein [Exidia glandulosa HHB12029]
MLSRAPLSDPFARLLAPPANETPAERQMREEMERAAKLRSDAIDEELKKERNALKSKRVMKLLLLGQSESGKSTTLQFQLAYTPQAFKAERATWRGVIQLNVVRSIRLILDTVVDALDRQNAPSGDDDSSIDHVQLTEEHDRLCRRLTRLRDAEARLMAQISAPAEEGDGFAQRIADKISQDAAQARVDKELAVRANWKQPFQRHHPPGPRSSVDAGDYVDAPTDIINELRQDMATLWTDPDVRELLRRQKIRVEETSGFFLNDLERVTARNYFPTSDDVLRARLKTEGVSEYVFQMEMPQAREHAAEWRIIDVGGARSQRAAWMPFFDDASAIIFLAPISAFDQVLAEDRSVNRLEDSVTLWKQICGNKLLQRLELILFLNKMDILDSKLQSGVRLAKYVRSFGERPNDVENAAKYLRSKFHAIHREYSSRPRKFYCFATSVTDVVQTSGILAAVRDIITRQILVQSRLL